MKLVWERHPDWRLGQLLVNAARQEIREEPGRDRTRLFFVEDAQVERWLKEHLDFLTRLVVEADREDS